MKLVPRLLLAGVAAWLAACHDKADPQPGTSAQAYTASVAAVVASPADPARSEPIDVSAVVAASSETAQPVPVTF